MAVVSYLIIIRHPTWIFTQNLSIITSKLVALLLDVIPPTHQGLLGPLWVWPSPRVVPLTDSGPKSFLPLSNVHNRVRAYGQPPLGQVDIFDGIEILKLHLACLFTSRGATHSMLPFYELLQRGFMFKHKVRMMLLRHAKLRVHCLRHGHMRVGVHPGLA